MTKKQLPPIAITMGDPLGIGPETIARAYPRLKRICRPLVIGDPEVMQRANKLIGLKQKLNQPSGMLLHEPRLDSWEEEVRSPKAKAACQAMASVRMAVLACMKGMAAALVTAPINKARLALAGYPYAGHTDYLAFLTSSQDQLMMLVGGKLRVCLVTTHLPLSKVAAAINKDSVLRAIRIAARGLRESYGLKTPRLAVLGLNPHAGDEGALGDEEKKAIFPALKQARRSGIAVSGPFPADALLRAYGSPRTSPAYDAVICMYHDQGLVAVKMLAGSKGVNVTLGLPIVRTSPDHGTADDIAWRGKADPASLIAATEAAVEIAQRRK